MTAASDGPSGAVALAIPRGLAAIFAAAALFLRNAKMAERFSNSSPPTPATKTPTPRLLQGRPLRRMVRGQGTARPGGREAAVRGGLYRGLGRRAGEAPGETASRGAADCSTGSWWARRLT
jgi:hypothetical protein